MHPDVVIVGGGIIGACCAYYLSGAGIHVELFDRGSISSGTSGATQCGIGHVNEGVGHELTIVSNRLYRDAARELPIDIELNIQGNTYVALTTQEMARLEHTAERLRGMPIRCDLLDCKQLREIEAHITPPAVGGLYFPDDGTVQSILATIGFALGAEQRGAVLRPFTEVTGIDVVGDAVRAVRTPHRRIPTKSVVIAAGVWSGSVGRMAGIDVPIVPRKGQLVVVEPSPPLINTYLLDAGYSDAVADNDADTAIAMAIGQTRSGTFLLGSSRQFVGFDRLVDPYVIRSILQRCIAFVPCLARLNAIRTYAGLRPCSPDLQPIIGAVDSVESLYVATGHEGGGITMGPVTGLLMAQLITGRSPDIDISDLALSRFAGIPDTALWTGDSHRSSRSNRRGIG